MREFNDVVAYHGLTPEQRPRFDAQEGPTSAMTIAVIGGGYVGLTVSACAAKMGHRVVCVEKDPNRLAILQEGRPPFYEPGLEDLIRAELQAGILSFTNDVRAAARAASIVFIAVGTPAGDRDEPDLSALAQVIYSLASLPGHGRILAIKSTVPVNTTDWITDLMEARGGAADIAYNPEFLREGSAVDDYFHPFRVIIGTSSRVAADTLSSFYRPLQSPILVTTPRTAEMIKYASNAFLATKISFVNEIATICERTGADIDSVVRGMGTDPRIGPHYLQAGIGFGGSCLPKDLRALAAMARLCGITPHMLDAVAYVNTMQRQRFVETVDRVIGGLAGKTLAVLGLSYKAHTSDVRDSPALDIAGRLLARGASVRTFDPAAEEAAARLHQDLTYCPDAYDTANGADAVLVLTDWPEFLALDWEEMRKRVRQPMVLDGRGMPIADRVAAAGFAYLAFGRAKSASAVRRSHPQETAHATGSVAWTKGQAT